MRLYKIIIISTLIATSISLSGCVDNKANKQNNESSNVQVSEVETNENEAINDVSAYSISIEDSKNLDISQERPFIIDPALLNINNKSLKNKIKYEHFDSINYQNNAVSLNVFVDKNDFEGSINNVIQSVSLVYSLVKIDDRKTSSINIDLYDYNGAYIKSSSIKIEAIPETLKLISNGIDGGKKYQIYEALDLISFIELEFPSEYKNLVQIKEQKNEIEILRNKGEVDDLFINSELFNIDKLANNTIRKNIKDEDLSIRGIDLKNNKLKANVYINLKSKPEDEINKVIKSMFALYTFIDFHKEITHIELTVSDRTAVKLEVLTIETAKISTLIKDYRNTTNKKELSKKMDDIIDFNILIKHFKKTE